VKTTFDRYLLRRFAYVFAILFVTTFGLFVVIDAFTNVDGFQEGTKSTLGVLAKMAAYYGYQSSVFFAMTGPILAVIASMVVLAILQKNSEIQPVLAAGVPAYRLIVPLIAGMLAVNGVLIANQEFVIPRISHHLQANRNQPGATGHDVEPVYDYETHIYIDGDELFLDTHRMHGAKFVLPVPEIALELTTLKSAEAVYYRERAGRPSGWLLKHASPAFPELNLTPAGRQVIHAVAGGEGVFVVTDVSFDQLYNRSRNYKFIPTPELLRRINNPAIGMTSVRGQIMHLHARLTQPLTNLFCVLIVLPLIIRRESKGLVTNLAMCSGVLGVVFVVSQVFLYLGSANLIAPDQAAWAPVVFSGTLGAWLSGFAQT
jgi:lipopolysaccharide export system permease protein